jgi:hypothetical protein
MPQDDFRIFLSAVTSEFGLARDTVAADLGAREVHLRVQREFRQEGESDTTLRKLHDYIRNCSATRRNSCTGGRWQLTRGATDPTIPTLRQSSTTSLRC